MTWPPKQDYEFVYRRPARHVFVPEITSTQAGARREFFDTELYVEQCGIQMVMFQRQLGQCMAVCTKTKDDKMTNMVQPSQLPQPYQFSLFGIAADYPTADFPESKYDGHWEDGLVRLKRGTVHFAHGESRYCFECKLRDLPTLEQLEKKPIPEWFMKRSREFMTFAYERACGISHTLFPEWDEQWKPCETFRHIQCGDAFQVVLKWEEKIPIICPIKISLYGVLWFPK